MSTSENKPQLITNRARDEMIDHAASHVFVRDFDPVISDEPPARGGHNQGSSPLEYILVALCA
jgi:uncharacterized OsmC-like protein